MDRIVLNASLNNIAKGGKVEESVKSAVEVLLKLSNLSNGVLFFMKDRPGSSFLQDQLSYYELEKVGHYECTRKQGKEDYLISFVVPEHTIEFLFKRKNLDLEEEVMALLNSKDEFAREQRQRAVLDIFSKALHESSGHLLTSMSGLGGQSRSLDTYLLQSVSVLRQVSRRFLGYNLPLTKIKREVVYNI